MRRHNRWKCGYAARCPLLRRHDVGMTDSVAGARGARRRSFVRRWLRRLLWLVVAFVAVTWLPVVTLRFVPPFTSAYMLERKLAQAWQIGRASCRERVEI